jgi:fumarate hydratase subunit beta
MTERLLEIPCDEDDIRQLTIGDVVHITGDIITGRDEAHIRALEYNEQKKELPVNFSDSALFHCGPIMQKRGEQWHLVAAGPTTSSRMNTLEPEFIESFGVRAVIGKGGMSQPTLKAMETHGCVYLAATGGAALLAARGIVSVKDVHWLDLGMPEALWVLEAKRFGPLIVAMDSHGNSLYEHIATTTKRNIVQARKIMGLE